MCEASEYGEIGMGFESAQVSEADRCRRNHDFCLWTGGLRQW